MILKMPLMMDKSPPQLELFFFGGENENFVNASDFLSPKEDNNELISFLCPVMGQKIMTNNSLSIHVESGDIFYHDFNTKEHFHNFLFAQQDERKQIIPKRISYHHSFESYTHEYLLSFSLEEIDKFDMLSNKNSKCLLYKFNDWVESMNAEKILIKHTSKVKDEVGLQKIEEKGKQFLIEEIISNIEKKSVQNIGRKNA